MEDDFEVFAMIGGGGVSGASSGSSQLLEGREPNLPEENQGRAACHKMSGSTTHTEFMRIVKSDRRRANGLPGPDETVHCAIGTKQAIRQPGMVPDNSLDSLRNQREEEEPAQESTYRILLLGADGVGKTALTQQFLSAEDVAGADYQDDGEEKYCTVSVDGQESFLIFMDSDFDKNSYDPSSAIAYIVVYSCAERETFVEAKGLLKNLRHFEKNKAIILCGNKSDLARGRRVTTEDGRKLAAQFEAEFIETSTTLNHRVDNLLVCIVSQIRSQLERQLEASGQKYGARSDFRKSVKGFVDKIVKRRKSSKELLKVRSVKEERDTGFNKK